MTRLRSRTLTASFGAAGACRRSRGASVGFGATAASLLLGSTLLLVMAGSAAAQPAPPPINQGPMTVERLHGGWIVAPDVKVTDVDHTTSALAGGYGGWRTAEGLFIGGGGYWLANQASDRKLGYGGMVLGWLPDSDRRIGFGVRGLIGGGEATLGVSMSQLIGVPDLPNVPFGLLNNRDLDRVVRDVVTRQVRYRRDFFVAEPQADVILKLTSRLRLTGGVGYRLIDTDGRDDNRLQGATGSVALQIGWGS
jgi:hypothetical protein